VLYLDSSAIVKLIAVEPETPDLADAVQADPQVVSSALAWTEVVRAVRRGGRSVARARRVLEGIARVPIDDGIVRGAANLAPPRLRTLDAIHLATALSLREELTSLITCDDRLAEAAVTAGLPAGRPT
jgi:predicted nucleic acid-binding protein